MIDLRVALKRAVMAALYMLVAIWARGSKKKLGEVKTVGILFLPVLGIGDLVMLSPVIQEIANIFSSAEVTLVTWVPEIIQFKNIRILPYRQAQSQHFDLVISPTLNLKHLPFIFKSAFWIGYFATNRIQSNFGAPALKYQFARGHFLRRGIELLKALSPIVGEKWEKWYAAENIPYPSIITTPPVSWSQTLGGLKYAVFCVVAQFAERAWPVENFAAVARHLMARGWVDKIVLVGGKSANDQRGAEEFMARVGLPADRIVNTTGQNSLTETAWLIKHSAIFLGLDVGPTHLAYGLAPRLAVIFITVDPSQRILRQKLLSRNVTAIIPNPAPPPSLYTGLARVSERATKQYRQSITVAQVTKIIDEIMNNPRTI